MTTQASRRKTEIESYCNKNSQLRPYEIDWQTRVLYVSVTFDLLHYLNSVNFGIPKDNVESRSFILSF
jgi:hypothetical protein